MFAESVSLTVDITGDEDAVANFKFRSVFDKDELTSAHIKDIADGDFVFIDAFAFVGDQNIGLVVGFKVKDIGGIDDAAFSRLPGLSRKLDGDAFAIQGQRGFGPVIPNGGENGIVAQSEGIAVIEGILFSGEG